LAPFLLLNVPALRVKALAPPQGGLARVNHPGKSEGRGPRARALSVRVLRFPQHRDDFCWCDSLHYLGGEVISIINRATLRQRRGAALIYLRAHLNAVDLSRARICILHLLPRAPR
jgi:hypothetical protein